jgi:hypothetical protein
MKSWDRTWFDGSARKRTRDPSAVTRDIHSAGAKVVLRLAHRRPQSNGRSAERVWALDDVGGERRLSSSRQRDGLRGVERRRPSALR